MASQSPVKFARVLASKVGKISIKMQSQREGSIARVSQTLYYDFIALVSLNIECKLFDFVGRKEVNQGSCENFQPFFKDFLRTTLDFQG